jgi:hypothetical protein
VRPCVIVVVDKLRQRDTGFGERPKAVAPTRLFFEGLDEALTKPVLPRRVGCDVLPRYAHPLGSDWLAIFPALRFLSEAVVFGNGAEAP